MITQEYLKECFIYNELNGMLSWKARPLNHFKSSRYCNRFNKNTAGKTINSLSKGKYGNKYYKVTVNGISHGAHRIIWILLYNEIPNHIDHIDGNGLNNIASNLRSVSRQENNRNVKARINTESGVTGVYLDKNLNKWKALIHDCGCIYLGYFEHKVDAVIARKMAEYEHGYHKNHGV